MTFVTDQALKISADPRGGSAVPARKKIALAGSAGSQQTIFAIGRTEISPSWPHPSQAFANAASLRDDRLSCSSRAGKGVRQVYFPSTELGMIVLNTTRLTLSPCSPRDRVDFVRLELDPEVMRFLNNGAVDHDRINPANAPFLMPRGNEPNVWTARGNADDEFVGWFCLSPKGGAVAEIGYRLRRKAWGQGLASEGAAALIGWGFEGGGYDSIVAHTMAVNQGSRRVMEKIGMKHTRTDFLDFPDPIPGTEHGEVTYELSHSEWVGI